MKILETILNILIRIINIPLGLITFVVYVLLYVVLLFVVFPFEFFLVAPIFYIVTGKWYFTKPFSYKHKWANWFPIIENFDSIPDMLPVFKIKEIHFKQ